ncbi:hypothetical protein DAPPUDRAFT_308628 [Daphnia pulex]|uniref:J domain-containing protein n=1 Tax=Daphnia pulex TaxID=6669 RepID=E9H8D4_DAPPU|nr:hypothetical protein DAPPUDRAFT_308628 [Daphnia pulex]|eukprot:EFX71969.1 hypothetical protein DAPPUDRAFT_308628 [Daphnia pulex]
MITLKMADWGPHSRQMYSILICLVSIGIIEVHGNANPSEIEKHLELGKLMMAKGQLQDALTHFHAALEGDPSNYLTLYRRATVYLAQGRARAALEDLNRVLEIQPDFIQARAQKGNILMKLGRLHEAHIELEKVLKKEPTNSEVNKNYIAIESLKKSYMQVQMFFSDKDYHHAIDLLTQVIDICPWDIGLREMRSECYLAIGEASKAISDLKAATKLMSDNTGAFMKLSKLYYGLGEPEESLNQVRECLKLDPEHKECFPHYKKVKKVAKLVQDLQTNSNDNNYQGCITSAKKVLKVDPTVSELLFLAEDKLCHCHLQLGEHSESLEFCSSALARHTEPRILCDRAEDYIALDMLDEAQQDYAKALEIEESFNRAKEGMQKVQKLQKQAKKRDYYKILGVKKNANKREIVKAYRKQAQQWHPDNFQNDEESRKKAEKKFIDIAAAKEVLTDPEKRQKYDNGEDPLDPESQQGQGFNPFQQGGFHNFHGGQFKFHFN